MVVKCQIPEGDCGRRLFIAIVAEHQIRGGLCCNHWKLVIDINLGRLCDAEAGQQHRKVSGRQTSQQCRPETGTETAIGTTAQHHLEI